MENEEYGDQTVLESENGNAEALEAQETAPETESVEELKAKLAKAEELANNYKARSEKAEAKAKENKAKPEAPKGDLSSKDLYALMNAKVNEDDIEVVSKYARFEKISVAEALKTTEVKAILGVREEQRNVAAATNVGTSKRTSAQISDETLLSKASKGELPESDADFARLVAARRKR